MGGAISSDQTPLLELQPSHHLPSMPPIFAIHSCRLLKSGLFFLRKNKQAFGQPLRTCSAFCCGLEWRQARKLLLTWKRPRPGSQL